MTGQRDTERVLAAFLAGGPEWAPAAALDAALDHARRHPRRHGPGAWLVRLAGGDVRPIAGHRVA